MRRVGWVASPLPVVLSPGFTLLSPAPGTWCERASARVCYLAKAPPTGAGVRDFATASVVGQRWVRGKQRERDRKKKKESE